MKLVKIQVEITPGLQKIIRGLHRTGLMGLTETDTVEQLICRGIGEVTRGDGLLSSRLHKAGTRALAKRR